jgi:hypothetical protein
LVTFRDVEQFALSLPETTSEPSYGGELALKVNKRFLARQRVEMAEQVDELTGEPYGEVLVLKVADLGEKEALIASSPRAFFTVAHYDGYATVLVRMPLVSEEEIRETVMESWMALAPKRALRSYVDRGGVLPES